MKNQIEELYRNSCYTPKDIANHFNIKYSKAYAICKSIYKAYKKPKKNIGIAIERIVNDDTKYSMRYSKCYIKKCIDMYNGVGEQDIIGLKSKVI